MKKISVLAQIGITFAANIVSFVFIATIGEIANKLHFETSDSYFLWAFYVFWCIIVFANVYITAHRRLMNKNKPAKFADVIKSFTPAQICIVAAFFVLILALSLSFLPTKVFSNILLFPFLALLAASVVLVVISIVKKIIEEVKYSNGKYIANKIYCIKCGTELNESRMNSFSIINGQCLCLSCSKEIEKKNRIQKYKPETPCCDCKGLFNKANMMIVDDEFVCQDCFNKRYGQ